MVNSVHLFDLQSSELLHLVASIVIPSEVHMLRKKAYIKEIHFGKDHVMGIIV